MTKMTEEQNCREKEINNIVELYTSNNLSYKEGNKQMGDLINDAEEEGLFSSEDICNYNERKDSNKSKYGPRSHIKFAMDLKKGHREEKKTFQHFFTWMRDIKGEKITYKLLGSDDKGLVMIANFKERDDNPNRPDYEINWNGKIANVEIKNFFDMIWLKINNLRKYKEWESYMVIKSNGIYYFFSKKTSDYLLKNIPDYGPIEIRGKKSIVITPDGSNAHFSLQKMFDLGLVKKM